MIYQVHKGLKQLLTGLILVSSINTLAADLSIVMTTKQGSLLRDAVVELTPINKTTSVNPILSNKIISISQKDKTFIPFLSVVPVGTSIDFPNMDKTRHHVYSFSQAKTFQLKLYIGKPETPIIFDTAGVVALGCNIHDFMESYIYVAQGQFARSSNLEGLIKFKNLPKGEYLMEFWHPWQDSKEVSKQIVMTSDNLSIQQSMDVYEEEYPTNEGINSTY